MKRLALLITSIISATVLFTGCFEGSTVVKFEDTTIKNKKMKLLQMVGSKNELLEIYPHYSSQVPDSYTPEDIKGITFFKIDLVRTMKNGERFPANGTVAVIITNDDKKYALTFHVDSVDIKELLSNSTFGSKVIKEDLKP